MGAQGPLAVVAVVGCVTFPFFAGDDGAGAARHQGAFLALFHGFRNSVTLFPWPAA